MKRGMIALLLTLTALAAEAQLISGVGLFAGVTYSRQKWFIQEPSESIKQKYLLRYNGEAFVEWFTHDNIRLVSELQYNMKGTKEQATGEKFKLDYFAFNNYLKLRQELFAIIPYVLVGPRVEYTFKSNEMGSKPFHFGVSGGVGFETVSFGQIAFITEAHYNPDMTYAGKDALFGPSMYDYKNRAWELRVGIKLNFREKNDCPPMY
jgi:hypothetical protein